MTSLDQEIEAYDKMRSDLEEAYFNKWVVVRDGEFAGVFDGPEESLQFAAERFGRGPYLIRQVGSPPAHLPASALLGAMSARS